MRRIIDQIYSVIESGVVRAAAVAAVTALGAGGAGALISESWRGVVIAIVGVIFLAILAVFFAEARKHDRELGEANFDDAQDASARKRESGTHERNHRDRVAGVTEERCDPAKQDAALQAELESSRRYIASGRADPIDLLLVCDLTPHASTVIAKAGRFDHARLEQPVELFRWLMGLAGEERAHSALIPGLGAEYRLVGLADLRLTDHAKFEIERAASHAQNLMLAQLVAGLGAQGHTNEGGSR